MKSSSDKLNQTHKHYNKALTIFMITLFLTLAITTAMPIVLVEAQTTKYVAETGNNSNDGSQGSPWLTISYAISQVSAGDTIIVGPGTYTENLVVDKALTLQSSDGAASTIINAANPNDYVVKMTADGVTLDGFTITGRANIGENHAAVITMGVDYCTITNNILTDNYKDAINLFSVGTAYSDYNTVSNNVINGPDEVGETFGIKVKGSHNTISGNEVYNTDSPIHIWSWSDTETASPDYNTISGNTIAQGAGGTAAYKWGVDIKTGQYNKVTGNTITGAERAAIYLYTSDRMQAEGDFDPRPAHCTISDNTITGGEVGIALMEGANTNTISGNDISGTSVAGILGSLSRWPGDFINNPSTYLVGTPQQYLQITDNTISGNNISNCGHGVAMEYADDNTLTGNAIENNAGVAAINWHGVVFTANARGVSFDANSQDNVVNNNNIVGNTGYGLENNNPLTTLDAENNYWGSGGTGEPGVGGNNGVSTHVDYDPWLVPGTEQQTGTATGTGTAKFNSDVGAVSDATPIDEADLPTAGKPDRDFPHGFFSFYIAGLAPGAMVTVTITLPSAVPVGTQYWKYHASEGGWIQIPMGSNNGDNVITITLIDGGLGDDDGIANGIIDDQGGPGNPPPKPVGGEVFLIDKLALLAPYIMAILLIATTATIIKKRRY